VHREASPLLYASNCFEFIHLNLCTPSLARFTQSAALGSFFTKIGHQNASFIRQICIDFPTISNYKPGSTTLQKDSVKTLELIRDKCTSIAELETTLRDTYLLETDTSPIVVEAALERVDTHFKAILSLKEVIVHIHHHQDPSDDLKKKMHDFGWTTKVTKVDKVEEYESDYNPPDFCINMFGR
jgi:hypothetical protein